MGEDHCLLMEVEKAHNQSKNVGRHRKKLLYKKVCEQMEFYFSDANLAKDRYLSFLIESDPYVPLEVFLRFNKISSMVTSVEAIGKALKKSQVLELSEDGLKVKRGTPVSVKENEDERTIYVENLAPETTHEDLKRVFSEFGKVLYVSIPKYSNTHAIKGFAFVEFDTSEEAMKTVEIFREKGSCLSSQMLPEKLCSIQTFEDPNRDEGKPRKVTFKIEHDIKTEQQEESDCEEPQEESGCGSQLEPSAKKLKSEIDSLSGMRNMDGETEENDSEEPASSKENKLKRKRHGHDDSNLENGKETDLKDKKKRKVDSEGKDKTKQVDCLEENKVMEVKKECDPLDEAKDQEIKSRKKNRKKKKKTKGDKDLFASGMHILPKKEWKRLRNKYLNMQRSNMKKVKQQLAEARFMKSYWYNPHQQYPEPTDNAAPVDTSKARVSFTPGVIIRVGFNEPVADIKLFKLEASSQPSVQYVDIHEGSCEAYLRCSTASDAQQLLQNKLWENMSLVQCNEENAYWEKIYKDREEKIGKKRLPRKQRGREKLIHRAETLLATHLHFDT